MSARALNKVMLIGNLTRDPELRYTPSGTAVCSFGLATNRQWTTDAGEKKEEAEFHRILSWNKLAELCSQLLAKGRKVYVEGRLQTRTWQGQDGVQRTTTEIVISDMIILDSRRSFEDKTAPSTPVTTTPVVTDTAGVVTTPAETPVTQTTTGTAETAGDTANPAAAAITVDIKKTAEDNIQAKKTRKKPAGNEAAADKPKTGAEEEDIDPDDIPF